MQGITSPHKLSAPKRFLPAKCWGGQFPAVGKCFKSLARFLYLVLYYFINLEVVQNANSHSSYYTKGSRQSKKMFLKYTIHRGGGGQYLPKRVEVVLFQ